MISTIRVWRGITKIAWIVVCVQAIIITASLNTFYQSILLRRLWGHRVGLNISNHLFHRTSTHWLNYLLFFGTTNLLMLLVRLTNRFSESYRLLSLRYHFILDLTFYKLLLNQRYLLTVSIVLPHFGICTVGSVDCCLTSEIALQIINRLCIRCQLNLLHWWRTWVQLRFGIYIFILIYIWLHLFRNEIIIVWMIYTIILRVMIIILMRILAVRNGLVIAAIWCRWFH